jgi:hypothetical protein
VVDDGLERVLARSCTTKVASRMSHNTMERLDKAGVVAHQERWLGGDAALASGVPGEEGVGLVVLQASPACVGSSGLAHEEKGGREMAIDGDPHR